MRNRRRPLLGVASPRGRQQYPGRSGLDGPDRHRLWRTGIAPALPIRNAGLRGSSPTVWPAARGASPHPGPLAGETYRLDRAQSLLVSVDLPVDARVVEATPSRSHLAVRISLDPAVVGELLADGVTASLGSPARGLAVTPVEPPLLGAVTRLAALLDSPQDVEPLAPLVLREITYRVLTGPQGSRLRQIASAGAPPSGSRRRSGG